jgi:hypothetical protein
MIGGSTAVCPSPHDALLGDAEHWINVLYHLNVLAPEGQREISKLRDKLWEVVNRGEA